jgi:hypothetical protein
VYIYFVISRPSITRNNIWAASWQNQQSAFASAQSDQDPCCSLSVSLLVIGFVSEQHGSWSDYDHREKSNYLPIGWQTVQAIRSHRNLSYCLKFKIENDIFTPKLIMKLHLFIYKSSYCFWEKKLRILRIRL